MCLFFAEPIVEKQLGYSPIDDVCLVTSICFVIKAFRPPAYLLCACQMQNAVLQSIWVSLLLTRINKTSVQIKKLITTNPTLLLNVKDREFFGIQKMLSMLKYFFDTKKHERSNTHILEFQMHANYNKTGLQPVSSPLKQKHYFMG